MLARDYQLVQMAVQKYQVENQVQDEHVCFAFPFFSIIYVEKETSFQLLRHFSAVNASGGGNRRRFGRKFVG